MVGAIIGAAAQIGSSIYGAVKSSQAAKRAQALLQSERDANRKWYEEKMSEDYMQRADIQNILRKQKELFQKQYQRARATNIVAGGTDESLALQQEAANEAMADTMADIAAQSTAYKDSIEQQYRQQDAAYAQQQIATKQEQAQAIANAAGQVGSAVGGLASGLGSGSGAGSVKPSGVSAGAGGDTISDSAKAAVAADMAAKGATTVNTPTLTAPKVTKFNI